MRLGNLLNLPELGATPANPAAGLRFLWFTSAGLFYKGNNGTILGPLGLPVREAVSAAYALTVTPTISFDDLVLNIGALTGNVTVANPVGATPTDGQHITIRFVQDATGTRTYTFGTAYAFGTDVTVAMLPTTANAKCELILQYNATDSKWRAVGIARGF